MKKRPTTRPPAATTVGATVPPARPSALPAPRDLADPRLPYLVPLALLVVARLVAWRELPFASEDAYITFRFARSLAGGYGLVYNPGVPVFGFSSPLWTFRRCNRRFRQNTIHCPSAETWTPPPFASSRTGVNSPLSTLMR